MAKAQKTMGKGQWGNGQRRNGTAVWKDTSQILGWRNYAPHVALSTCHWFIPGDGRCIFRGREFTDARRNIIRETVQIFGNGMKAFKIAATAVGRRRNTIDVLGWLFLVSRFTSGEKRKGKVRAAKETHFYSLWKILWINFIRFLILKASTFSHIGWPVVSFFEFVSDE